MADIEDAPDFSAAQPESSSEDEDGPPLDAYWTSMLNVSATAAPLAHVPPEKPDESDNGKGKAKGKGKLDESDSGKGKAKGKGGSGKAGSSKGKGGKKGSAKGKLESDVGSFNPGVFRPDQRDRSRSPHGQKAPGGLANFMSWARHDNDDAAYLHTKAVEAAAQGGLNNFMAWASEDAPLQQRVEDRAQGGLNSFMAWAAEGKPARSQPEHTKAPQTSNKAQRVRKRYTKARRQK